ncbi:MAG: rRNA pseudouridine synthase, partial [Proteobacteria bacterium]|nr:rRNA pseudouridine synthase [Pseudomonadota bacterium]
MENKKEERIAKRIARAGVCSRRDAEKLILAGKVKINNVLIDTPAIKVSDKDIIEVNGEVLDDKAEARLWMYHKPKGLITSHKDDRGRETVFSSLPP